MESLRLISDFNLSNLTRLLEGQREAFSVQQGSFGDVVPALIGAGRGADASSLLVWTRPEAVLPAFGDILDHRAVAPEILIDEVDAFAELVKGAAAVARTVLVPKWTSFDRRRGLGMLDYKSDAGLGLALLRANTRLVENLARSANAYVLDADRWLRADENPAAADRMWHLAKIPVSAKVLKEAAVDIVAALDGVAGKARKLVVLDLDNTLWGGVVGDVGWEALQLGGHDAKGEAFVEFQQAVKSLTNRGIVLGIVSKNEESVALEAMRRHDAMVLNEADFAGWRINWRDKAQNVADLTAELNLGLQSVVFIDDHPAERARVREALPEVLVPEWPSDPLRYASELRRLRCFDAPSLSEEDVARARMYATERQRQSARAVASSVEEWLRSLEIAVQVEPLNRGNLARATQLLNKTNQMNLRTRRLTEAELREWAEESGRAAWTVRVADRFGDYGLTGLVSVESGEDAARLADFVLSCRVFGRKIEETMIHIASVWARQAGLTTLEAHFSPTPKNKPCLEFFEQRSGFARSEDGVFRLGLREAPAAPDAVALNTIAEGVG